jgi:hypothetical protein
MHQEEWMQRNLRTYASSISGFSSNQINLQRLVERGYKTRFMCNERQIYIVSKYALCHKLFDFGLQLCNVGRQKCRGERGTFKKNGVF